MRFSSLSMALGALCICALFANTLRAQEQPAAGSPPPGAAYQAPAAGSTQPPAAGSTQPPASPPAPEANVPAPRMAPDPQRAAQRQVWMLTRRLGLTPAQRSEIEPILANRIRLIASIRHDPTLVPWQKRTRIAKINKDSNGEIETILSGPQIEEYHQILQERLAHQREMQQQRQQQRQQQQQMGGPPVG
ncbi:MAG: hypothetical protein ACP5E5_02795 [Acidobacteriaceae bacterium]